MTNIRKNIKLIEFFEAFITEIIFVIDKKALKKLVINKKIYVKLIFYKYISLNWGNYYKFKAFYYLIIKITWLKQKKRYKN